MTEVSWRNGFWFNNKVPSCFMIANDGKMDCKAMTCVDYPDLLKDTTQLPVPLKLGQFGPARRELVEATGKTEYNLKLGFFYDYYPETFGVINEGGTEITFWGGSDSLEVLKWMSEEDFEKLKNDMDHKASPRFPNYITPRAGQKGKIAWLSGPPGCGKSTTCQLLAQSGGFVYYEADCTLAGTNPFIDIHADNVWRANAQSQSLKGWSLEDAKLFDNFNKDFISFVSGQSHSSFDSLAQPFLKLMCREVEIQRRRLGGDFAVAYLVQTRKSRDLCRALCPDLVFITMTMTESCQKKRLKGRFGDQEIPPFLIRLFEESEPAGDDEENAYNIMITEEMTREDVLNKVLEHI